MSSIVEGLKNIVAFIEVAFKIANTAIHNIIHLLKYLTVIMPKLWAFLLTIPPYIQIFAQLTLAICLVYLMVGRNSGKSD